MGKEMKSPAPEECTSGNHSRNRDLPESIREENWKHAQERMMLYLRSLDAPFRRGLVLALEALEIAEKGTQANDQEARISEGIQALKRLMFDQGLFTSEGPDYGEWFRYRTPFQGQSDQEDLSGGLRSMPPLHRGSMKPEKAT